MLWPCFPLNIATSVPIDRFSRNLVQTLFRYRTHNLRIYWRPALDYTNMAAMQTSEAVTTATFNERF
jgi:uncharacterized protein YdhG (YjbR/CyaY superfamily)